MIDIDNATLASPFPGIGNQGKTIYVIDVPSYNIQNSPQMGTVTTTLGALTGGIFIQVQAQVASLDSRYLVCDTMLTNIDDGPDDTFSFQFFVEGGLVKVRWYWFSQSGTTHATPSLTITAKVFYYSTPFS